MRRPMLFIFLFVVVLIGAGFLWWTYWLKPGNTINTLPSPESATSHHRGYVLKPINLDDGNYAVRIRHTDHGDFVITDREVLKRHQDTLRAKVSLLNYLPGEADRTQGVYVFKDAYLIDSVTGALFSEFTIGDLKNYGVPVEYRFETNNKEKTLALRDTLLARNDVFFFEPAQHLTDIAPHSYTFTVDFPTIVLGDLNQITFDPTNTPNYMSSAPRTEIEAEIEKIKSCITSRVPVTNTVVIEAIMDKSYNPGLRYGTQFEPGVLRYASTNEIIYPTGLVLVNPTVIVSGDRSYLENLLDIDFSGCIPNQATVLEQLETIKQSALTQSSTPQYKTDDIWYEDFSTEIRQYPITERTYQIEWLELAPAKKLE